MLATLSVFEQELLRSAFQTNNPTQIFVRQTDQSDGPFVSCIFNYWKPENRLGGFAALKTLIALGYVEFDHENAEGRKAYRITAAGREVAATLPPVTKD